MQRAPHQRQRERHEPGTHRRSVRCSVAPVSGAGGWAMRLSKAVSCASTSCSQTGMLSGEADGHMKGNAMKGMGRAGFPVPQTSREQPWWEQKAEGFKVTPSPGS